MFLLEVTLCHNSWNYHSKLVNLLLFVYSSTENFNIIINIIIFNPDELTTIISIIKASTKYSS